MEKHSLTVRKYHSDDETGWLRCRVLAFLDTAYYDDVYQKKEIYESGSIELVASLDSQIVGLLDIECESEPNTICSMNRDLEAHLGGMIWHLAVHPDYRRQGIGKKLLQRAKEIAREMGIERFEAWTRDDEWVESWYRDAGFEHMQSYYHVYIEPSEGNAAGLDIAIPQMRIQTAFAHYTGDDLRVINRFKRVHKCNRYDLIL